MKKVKLLFSKILEFFKKGKVKEPIQKDLEKSNQEPDSNYVGDFEKKQKDNQSKPITKTIENYEPENKLILSQPYVIKIVNDLDIPIENFSLFGLYEENDKYFDENGNLVKDGLTISSDVFEISYKKICENFKKNAFKIGLTYIRSETNNQVLQNFTFKYQNINGLFFGKKLIPTIDPFQQQSRIIAMKSDYLLDENTSIVYSKIFPKTTLYIYFYPIEQIFDESTNVNEQIAYFISTRAKK
jgi:hypothetical protein